MKVLTKVKFILIFIIIMCLTFYKVNAASLSVKAESNTSEILTNKVVYVDLSLTNFVDIDTSDDMAMSGSIEYDDSIEHGEKIDNILKEISKKDKELKEKLNSKEDNA